MMMKLPGRVGDSAIIGAGTYATACGGASATGHGEPIIRHVFAKVTVDAIAAIGVREAVAMAIEIGRGHGVKFGIISLQSEAVTTAIDGFLNSDSGRFVKCETYFGFQQLFHHIIGSHAFSFGVEIEQHTMSQY